MKFLFGYTLDFQHSAELEVIEIITLEEFLTFVASIEESVIIHPSQDGPWELEIYDGYRE